MRETRQKKERKEEVRTGTGRRTVEKKNVRGAAVKRTAGEKGLRIGPARKSGGEEAGRRKIIAGEETGRRKNIAGEETGRKAVRTGMRKSMEKQREKNDSQAVKREEKTKRAPMPEVNEVKKLKAEEAVNETKIEGRNAVIEAFRSGRTVDRLFLLEGSQEGQILTVKREAAKRGTPVKFVTRQRLDQISDTGNHQGVIAYLAAYAYAEVEDLFRKAREKDEYSSFILRDTIEDPHTLGAIIHTANVVGAHGVIIPRDRAVGLTATVAKASAGALNFTPVAKVTNLARTIEELKERGMWFVCADMDGTPMTSLNMTGSLGLVIGAEGSGVSRLVREKCDMIASIPQKGEINSLNASVAAGVLCYEIFRQRNL